MDNEVKYIHTDAVHNLNASSQVVPFLNELFKPLSVLDAGCGTGTWLKSFLLAGVHDVMGLDGDYVNLEMLKENISISQFVATDLCQPFDLHRRFDLVLSLEVAEHLPEATASGFVNSLVKHGDIIVFSAALPGQGGQNHLNEQPKSYWIEKFAIHGFQPYDLLRPKFWNDDKVDWWYKQNMLVFSSCDLSSLVPDHYPILDVIHPGLLQQNLSYISYLQQYVNELETKMYEQEMQLRALNNDKTFK